MSVLQNDVRSKSRYVKILMDSGASASIIHDSFVRTNKFNTRKTSANKWSTMAGSFSTSCEVEVKLKLPELNVTAHIFAPFHVTSQKSNYDVIFGRDLLRELGINLDFQNNSFIWKETEIPMKSINCKMRTNFVIQDSKNIKSATNRIKKILDANYEKANLKDITNKLKYLNLDEQLSIYRLLKKHESMFDGTLGNYTGTEYKIELLEGVKPYHAKPFPIPKVHEETLKTEVNRLVKIGVLKRKNNSEWAAPTFIIPKKNGTVRFISDFRELNKKIKRKPFPFLKYRIYF